MEHRTYERTNRMKILIKNALIASVILLSTALGFAEGKYEVIPVPESGSMKGAVIFKGKLPSPKKMLIAKDYEACGKGERFMGSVKVDEKTTGVGNVVVYLEDIKAGKKWEDLPGGYLLEQKGCFFLPVVSIIPKGKDATLINKDSVFHNSHAYELVGKVRRDLFNVAQPAKGNKIQTPLKPRKSNLVKVECDVHNFMEGWLFIAENPYAVLTDGNGDFSIQNIPPGTYTLKAWHPVLGIQSAQVNISKNEEAHIEIQFGEKP